MGLFVLTALTFLFLIINFIITNGDFLHPSTLFCEMFLLYEAVCVVGRSHYAVTIHFQTVAVITCGLCVFTFFGILSSGIKNRIAKASIQIPFKPTYISIPSICVYSLIALQLITIIFFIKYLRDIAAAWGSGGSSIAEMVSLYDTMTKFWTQTFRELNVHIPMVYRIGNPVSSAAAYVVIYVAVNNYIVCRKIKISHIIVFVLLCVLILLNGSRSPLMRIVTMVVILVYIFYYRMCGKKKNDIKAFLKLASLMLIMVVFMFATLFIMGRASKLENIFGYLFIYMGAPIVNLDNFLCTAKVSLFKGLSSNLFGEHTFQGLYAYIGKWFKVAAFTNIENINTFTFSANGIEIGNVYTTFYPFIYDFGYIGVLPLISIVAIYYTFTYTYILRKPVHSKFDFRLFIYSYLFNDVIMLTFSSRFYETVFDSPFIKFFVVSWFIVKFLFDDTSILRKYKIKYIAH